MKDVSAVARCEGGELPRGGGAQGAMPHGWGGVAKRGLVDGSRTRECASMIGTWEECVYNIRCVWNYAVRSGALTLAQLAHRM